MKITREKRPDRVKKVEVKTYYKMENGSVIQFTKIGKGDWIKAVTPYKDLPWCELDINFRV